MRSPEVGTANHRSPSSRDKVVTDEQPAPVQSIHDVNMGYTCDPSLPLPSSTDPLSRPVQGSSSGKPMRDAQLRELLTSLGMTGRSSSSSSHQNLSRTMRPMTG